MAMQLGYLCWMSSSLHSQVSEVGASEEQFGMESNLGWTEMASPSELQAGSPAASRWHFQAPQAELRKTTR